MTTQIWNIFTLSFLVLGPKEVKFRHVLEFGKLLLIWPQAFYFQISNNYHREENSNMGKSIPMTPTSPELVGVVGEEREQISRAYRSIKHVTHTNFLYLPTKTLIFSPSLQPSHHYFHSLNELIKRKQLCFCFTFIFLFTLIFFKSLLFGEKV